MVKRRWPTAIRTLRGNLPAEMRILRGVVGAVCGVILGVSTLSILLAGNWQLGYGDDRILVAIFLVLLPAGLGILSPIWYWVGRPVWVRLDRPGDDLLYPFQKARFLPGLVGSVLGVILLSPVSATSRLLVQALAPFGLAIAVGMPLWYWVLRPAGVIDIERWKAASSESPLNALLVRSLVILGVLFGASLLITTAISLPVVGVGDSVTTDGLAVTVTETKTVPKIVETTDGTVHESDESQILLVRVSIENRGETQRHIPGTSVGDITVIAPSCRAQNFGEPSHNCNRVYVDGRFRVNEMIYTTYETRQAAVDGTINPGERISGWLAFRLESPPIQRAEFDSMVIVDDIGRWTLANVN